MNINDLTIGQAKELTNFFNKPENESSLLSSVIGKYVIVRSRNEGVNCGYVKQADDTGVILTDARRIYYHRPLDKKLSWYEGVAISGLDGSSKMSNSVSEKIIIEDYSITICTDLAKKSLIEYESNGQS